MKLSNSFADKKICIIGLGYVGLTLAVVMAEAGFDVYGVEQDLEIVASINAGRAHFSELGIDSRLAAQTAAGHLVASTDWPERGLRAVYIITVGTPLDERGLTNLDAIRAVTESLARVIKDGDLVVLRSTVRIGVSRELVKPILDAAVDRYDLAFCPERTLEGKALLELRTLPQIVGGADDASSVRASQMFNFITPTTIRVRDLETAEMIKLINNTQRDLMFAFANEVAEMCDTIGVSAVEVVRAGNMGYARASLPMPGPVGGPCLEKDAHILAESVRARGGRARLALLGREVNEELPARTVDLLAAVLGDREVTKIAIAGLAFKGQPETGDLRGSLALKIADSLRERYPSLRLFGFDPAVSAADAAKLGIVHAETAAEAFEGADAVIFQNNNPRFENLDLSVLAQGMKANAVIYDLWNQFDADVLSLRSDIIYFGIGSRVRANRGVRTLDGSGIVV